MNETYKRKPLHLFTFTTKEQKDSEVLYNLPLQSTATFLTTQTWLYFSGFLYLWTKQLLKLKCMNC